MMPSPPLLNKLRLRLGHPQLWFDCGLCGQRFDALTSLLVHYRFVHVRYALAESTSRPSRRSSLGGTPNDIANR